MHSQPRLDLNPLRETAPPVASGGILCGVVLAGGEGDLTPKIKPPPPRLAGEAA